LNTPLRLFHISGSAGNAINDKRLPAAEVYNFDRQGLVISHIPNMRGWRVPATPKSAGALALAKARFEAHTRGMNSGMQTTVIFACRKCGAIYQATQHRGADTHFGVFNCLACHCLACHTQVYAWHGLHDYLDWKVGFLVGRAVAKSGAR
jgi:hypothetical protein